MVTSEPEVSITQLVDEDAFLVLASDGLWDRMTNQEVVDFIDAQLRQHGDPQIASAELAKHAMCALRSSDNISILVIVPRKQPRMVAGRFPGGI